MLCPAARCFRLLILFCGALSLMAAAARGFSALEQWKEPTPLDPTAGITSPVLESQTHQALPEQYIGSSKGVHAPFPDQAQSQGGASYFRSSFIVSEKPSKATLYVAGPQQAAVFLNGQLVGNFKNEPTARLRPFVFYLVRSTMTRMARSWAVESDKA